MNSVSCGLDFRYGLPFWVDDLVRGRNVHFITGAHDFDVGSTKFHSKQITVVNSRQVFTAEINGFLIKNFLEMGARNFQERGNYEGIVHFRIVRNGICNLNFLTKKSETNHHVAKGQDKRKKNNSKAPLILIGCDQLQTCVVIGCSTHNINKAVTSCS